MSLFRHLLFAGQILASAAFANPNADPIYIYGIDFTNPKRQPSIAEDTIEKIREAVYPREVIVNSVDNDELDHAIRNNKADIVITVGGIYRRHVEKGMRDLVTLVTEDQPDPDHAIGAVVLVKKGSGIKTWEDLKGKSIALNAPSSFQATLSIKKEIFDKGYDPEKFFGKIEYMRTYPSVRLEAVRDGKVDATTSSVCFIERQKAKGNDILKDFEVLEPKKLPGTECVSSTQLYPNYTILISPSLSVSEIRKIANAVLYMPMNADGQYWTIASDFSAVDQLYRDLKTGPYQYLNSWTLPRIWDEFKYLIILLGFTAGFAVWHVLRTGKLVTKATEEILAATEEQRKFSRRYDSARRAVTIASLSNILVHELGQPLSTSSLYAKSLKKLVEEKAKTYGFSPEVLQNAIEGLISQLSRSNEIIRLVRGYAKSEGSVIETVDLNQATKKTVEIFRTEHPEEAKVLKLDLSGTKLPVEISSIEFEIALGNIIKNAVEASEGAKEKKIEISVMQDGLYGAVSVRDEAKDISDELLEKMRSPLISKKKEGLGLGLSIVRAIVSRYLGKLSIEKNAKTGLTVTLTFPLSHPQEEKTNGI